MNTITEAAPGVWVLRFPTLADVAASKCVHLIPPMEKAAKAGPLVLVAVLPAGLRLVEPNMPTFWLEVFTRRVKFTGLAVVTQSAAVRVVVGGFDIALRISGTPIRAETFTNEAVAVGWAKSVAEPRKALDQK